MRKQLSTRNAITLATILLTACITATATNTGFTTLNVNGEAVKIYRDDFGTPHIFAETNKGLFEGYGYAVAQDRLWQLELNRRAARGRLAEIFGSSTVSADRAARIVGYTDAELDAQFATLTAEEQEIFDAYLAGINRYIVHALLNPFAVAIRVSRSRLRSTAMDQTRFGCLRYFHGASIR